MALWEYKVITSGKGGFATPALLESYLNQLGGEDWEIIEFRTQPDNVLAFSGLARRPTQRDWTLEAAAAAAARAEADKLRVEFAAKFQAATKSPDEVVKVDESGNPVRDDSFRRPRETEYDQDPYALDDSSSEEPEDIPEEDQLPTFFEAVRPHMRRNQKGPGYSVGIEYLLKKFEMLEDDLSAALKEIGFVIPEDEDDKPVYIEYDGDIYWVNVNRRGEVWLNAREKPRQVFKITKGTRLTPEEEAPEQAQAEQEQQAPQRQNQNQNRRNERAERNEQRNEQRNRRQDAEQAQASAPVEVRKDAEAVLATEAKPEPSAVAEAPVEKPQREAAPAVVLPSGLDLLERLRPMMRRSRGGWSGTISYLSRALRQTDADLVAALAVIGLVPPATSGEKAPVVESGPFAYWLNKDGRGGIWINVREARRMRHEAKQAEQAAAEAAGTAAPLEGDVVETPVSAAEPASEGQVPASAEAPVSESQSVTSPEAPVLDSPLPVQEEPVVVVESKSVEVPVSSEPETEAVAPRRSETSSASTLPLAGVRLLLKELKPGSFSGEITYLASQLEKSEEAFVSVLVETGLKVPEKAREKPVFVEHAGEVFWLNRNAKGVLWLNAKASKYSTKDSEEESTGEVSEEDAGSAEKKPRRSPKPRKKGTGEEAVS